MMWVILYIIIGVITALGFAAWDNGTRWDTNRYLFLGGAWIVALPIIGLILAVKKLRSLK